MTRLPSAERSRASAMQMPSQGPVITWASRTPATRPMRWVAWRASPGSSFSSTTAVTATSTPSLRRLRRLYSAAGGGPPLRGGCLGRPAGEGHADQCHHRSEQVHRREDLAQHGYGDGHAEDGDEVRVRGNAGRADPADALVPEQVAEGPCAKGGVGQ